MKTRKAFLEAVMKMANLKDLKEAGAAARAVISLTKLTIGEELSQKIADVSPPDLGQGWSQSRLLRWMIMSAMSDYLKSGRLKKKKDNLISDIK